ncbi:site-specific integrase [Chryseobacterium sp. Leaf201]|uniref:site-specific integrase n=1 Tax=Chryseobacterium sp. Leaf201 TaxID=1735672 RepID=UPI0006F57478|nr:site-specific integrase [Chryseobacterium sp. Leaf201]KQM55246.1 hypothetical protein ASE55_07310 [Chryseobacterium sp. Leaf201]
MKFLFFLSQKKTISGYRIYLSFVSDDTGNIMHKFCLPLKIPREDWDPEKQRPVDIYCKKYKKLNITLNAIKTGISELLKSKSGSSAKTISAFIHKICSEKALSYPKGSLLSIMEEYLKMKKNLICLSTYRRYQVFIRLIEKFEGFLSRHIFIEEIDNFFLPKFYAFGREEKYTESTLNRTAGFIKTILNFAEKRGIRTNVKQLEIPKVKTAGKIMTLDEKEIKKIRQASIPENLQQAKNWLLISCYTGQRISDFMRFHIRQVVEIDCKKCISFVQQKTGKEIILPLHPIVLNILEKYDNSFPPPLENSLYNKQIKEVAFLAGITKPVRVRKRVGFRVKEIQVEKWQNISSHIGRRSFASNFYGKIPTPLLIQATGHSTEQMFLNYVNPLNHARILSLGNYFEKIHSEV